MLFKNYVRIFEINVIIILETHTFSLKKLVDHFLWNLDKKTDIKAIMGRRRIKEFF